MKLNEIIRSWKLSKQRRDGIVIVFLMGVFLLLIVTPISSKKTDKSSSQASVTANQIEMKENEQEVAYIEQLENKLEQTIRRMEGAGEVQVMITLEDSGEKIVDKNQVYENQTESQKNGTETKEKNVLSQTPETVLIQDDGNSIPFIVKQTYPKVSGVVVVCSGGGDPALVNQIKEVVEALFGIEAHKIVVCKSHNDIGKH